MPVDIARAETPEDHDAVRALIRDVFAWAMAHVAEGGKDPNPSVFADLDAELAGLPGRFGPPAGCLPLARLDGAPVSCIGFHGQDAAAMEIKRMVLRPEARGKGVGGWMLAVLLSEAEAAGCARHRLSTHHRLHAARALYHRAGFREVPGSMDSRASWRASTSAWT